jgi:hypothetical protein
MQEIRIFLLVYHEFAVIKLLLYRLHTKCTCTCRESIPVLLSCYVTRFVFAWAVIVFPRDNTPRIWCITSEAPPVRIERDRENPHLVSPPPCIDLATCVCLHGYRWSFTFLSDLSFRLVKQVSSLLLPTVVYPPVGRMEQSTKSYSGAFIYRSEIFNNRYLTYRRRILNVLTPHLIYTNRHAEELITFME